MCRVDRGYNLSGLCFWPCGRSIVDLARATPLGLSAAGWDSGPSGPEKARGLARFAWHDRGVVATSLGAGHHRMGSPDAVSW